MIDFTFSVLQGDSSSGARIGIITTPHGVGRTPAFVPVGTQATVKSMTPEDLDTIGVQLYFVNTYHMYLRPGIEVIKSAGGLHRFMHWNRPLMTDSGGFQVFSLAREKRPVKGLQRDEEAPQLVKITEDGVRFRSHWDGSLHMFTPESSTHWQWDLGADIHIAFDDCTAYPVSQKKARVSMERTHRWAKRSLDEHKRIAIEHRLRKKPYQALYGSIQGSTYEELRRESAKTITAMDFDGFAVGGVSVGESKKEMADVVRWVMPFLPPDKPRHLLGVGEIDDIFMAVENGIDTFDCVQPTRLARMGTLYVASSRDKNYQINITQSVYASDFQPVEKMCDCYTCRNYSRAYIHHLFHVRELLAYRLATIHNLRFIHRLMDDIRLSIKDNSFLDLKKKWL